MLRLKVLEEVKGLAIGAVSLQNVTVEELSEELKREYQKKLELVKEKGMAGGDERRTAVRKLLKSGGFKASGRNKPAQEYLWRSLSQDNWPFIYNVVDAINLHSVTIGLPISLLSSDRVGTELLVRYGRPGEKFVFNRAGQELDVKGLICIASLQLDGGGTDGVPVGSPVKDSMAGKVSPEDRNLSAFIYAPVSAVELKELELYTHQLAELFEKSCKVQKVSSNLIS